MIVLLYVDGAADIEAASDGPVALAQMIFAV